MAASYTKNAPHARGWRCGKGFGLQFRAASVACRGGPFLRVGVQEPGAGVCAPKEEKAMKKKNPLGLRVLSAAAVMSIVTSIATPAFADVYYIGNGSIDVIAEKDKDYVTVKQGDKEYHDTSSEIVLKDGTSEYDTTLKENKRAADKQAAEAKPVEKAADAKTSAVTTIGETEVTPAEEEPEEEEPTEKVEKKSSNEQPKAEPEGETKEQPEEPKAAPAAEEESKEEEPKEAAGDEQPKESVEKTDTEKTAEDETAPAKQKKQQPEAAAQDDATQGDAADQDEPETPAEGSEGNPTNNVIRVINNWVEKTLNIRLSNVHIKADGESKYQDGTVERDPNPSTPSMKVDGSGSTTIELDGKNVLDDSDIFGLAALNKQGEGTMTITDTTNDKGQQITSKDFDNDQSGSLKVTGGAMNGGAGIGGNVDQAVTKNITIEGFATVDATSAGNGAGIGGGGGYREETSGNAENITIQGNAHVKAKAYHGAAIGGGTHVSSDKTAGSAKGIVIRDHANVVAESDVGAGIGSGGWIGSADADVTIGTAGADSTTEDVHVTAKSNSGAAIGGSGVRSKGTTKVTIQGNVTIEEASSDTGAAIGSPHGDATVTIKDHAHVKKVSAGYSQLAIGGSNADNVTVNLEGDAVLDEVLGAIGAGSGVKNTVINIKDNVNIKKITSNMYWGGAIGGETTKDTETTTGNKVTVNIDGGKDGKVEIGTDGGVRGALYAINGTKVNLGENILLKLKQNSGNGYKGVYLSEGISDAFYQDKDKLEMKVGSTKKPEEGGLLNTIGANSAIWYTDYTNKLVKIVHGENLCVFDEAGKPDRIIEPTCTTPGYKVYKCHYEKNNEAGTPCSDPCCDREKWVEYTGALGHKETDLGEDKVHHDATCVKGGYWEGTCKTCGQKVEVPDGTEPDLTKHDYEGQEWVTTKEATCGAAGEKVLHCKRAPNDPSHDKTEMIPATGKHTWDEGKVTKAPTCTEEGEKTFTCTGCNETKTEKIPVDPNAHDYRDDWTVTTKPGCTTKGEETRHCHNNPEHTETRDIAPTGHEKTHVVGKKDPTETEPGYTGDEVCDKCGDVVKKGEVIPATGKMDAENAETLELRVVVPGNTLQDLLFTVRQADGERTYTCKKADATLTGTLETLQYLQANGAETIVFVTNGRVSRFAVADLLALCDEGDVFYLCHTADAEPTLLIIANDHTELLNK